MFGRCPAWALEERSAEVMSRLEGDSDMFHTVDRPSRSMSVGPLGGRFENVRRIAVLRGGGLGDLIFVLPAIEALAHAYPEAHITLLGTPMHHALLSGRPGPVHEVVELPVVPGVRDVRGQVEDPDATERFTERMRVSRFDLAVQLHGGGRYSNPFLLRLGARHTIGMQTPDAVELERGMAYVYYQHEMLRALEVVGLAGAPPVVLEPRLQPTPEERNAAARRVEHRDGALALVHPGATDARRRWPAQRFAEIARRLADDGAQVIVVGDGSDGDTAADITATAGGAGRRVSSLAGHLTLGELVGLFSHADVLVGNDSGPRHLAQAVGVCTVGVYWFPNLVNAGPFGRSRHRTHMSWVTRCPVCDRDCTQVGWTAERCEHDDSFVADVAPGPVYDDASELMATSLLLRGR